MYDFDVLRDGKFQVSTFCKSFYRSFCQFSLKVVKVPDRSSGSVPGPLDALELFS